MASYINEVHDEERAFYGISNSEIIGCTFAGDADGESALKETDNIIVKNCDFLLRYPLWHTRGAEISGCKMTETCRAALWYDTGIKISGSVLGGIKALRECSEISLSECSIHSTEFGWFCKNIFMKDCRLTSEYPFLQSSDMEFDNLDMCAKYSFQYTSNVTIRNSNLETKDAFWHSKNVTVYDSVVKGEYLGWYSEGLRLIRCKIIGTQPLCYAKNLVLEDCETEGCDLSFENSSVTADIRGGIESIKNPLPKSRICAENIGEIIMERPVPDCEIITK